MNETLWRDNNVGDIRGGYSGKFLRQDLVINSRSWILVVDITVCNEDGDMLVQECGQPT